MENQETQYAGFWLRFIAYIIDAFIISFVEFLMVLPLLATLGFNAGLDKLNGIDDMDWDILMPILISAGAGFYLTAFLTTWLYYALMESGSRQATVGKLALNLKVTDTTGDRISFATASLRFFGKILSNAIFMIGYIMAGFTQKKQALHDIIANTYVVKK